MVNCHRSHQTIEVQRVQLRTTRFECFVGIFQHRVSHAELHPSSTWQSPAKLGDLRGRKPAVRAETFSVKTHISGSSSPKPLVAFKVFRLRFEHRVTSVAALTQSSASLPPTFQDLQGRKLFSRWSLDCFGPWRDDSASQCRRPPP